MAVTRDKAEEEVCIGQEGKQEGISKGSNEQEFQSRFPVE
jgi:hypothetical protein